MRVHGGDGIHEDEILLHHPLHGAGGGGFPGPPGPPCKVLTAGSADGLGKENYLMFLNIS